MLWRVMRWAFDDEGDVGGVDRQVAQRDILFARCPADDLTESVGERPGKFLIRRFKNPRKVVGDVVAGALRGGPLPPVALVT